MPQRAPLFLLAEGQSPAVQASDVINASCDHVFT